MFKNGDIVKIKKEFLAPHEDPDQEYLVLEDYGDGKTKVFCRSDVSTFGGYVFVWDSKMFYKTK